MQNIFLTGATGFVGKSIANNLKTNGYNVITTSRSHSDNTNIVKLDLNQPFDLIKPLKAIDVVIHSAAKVHCMKLDHTSEQGFIDINVNATVALAKQAVEAGVKRFIYISSIKVNGESTTGQSPFSSDDLPHPEDTYGKSKYQAEQALLALAKTTTMEVVIVRPPLVYGPGVKANFGSLIALAKKPVPLPFGAINNKRSFIYVENFSHFVELAIHHPLAKNTIWCVSDDNDLSLRELLSLLITATGSKAKLVSIPSLCLVFLLTIVGKKNISDRLFGDLQVNIEKTKTILGWKPPFSTKEAINNSIVTEDNNK